MKKAKKFSILKQITSCCGLSPRKAFSDTYLQIKTNLQSQMCVRHRFFHSLRMSTKLVKNYETIAVCSRKIKKLYIINLSKTEYIDLLPLANLFDLCLEMTITCDFYLL